MDTKILNTQGKEIGTLELRDDVFARKVSPQFLHEYVTIYLANQRQRTAHTKTRGEVSGGGKKPWKQKHTGRARHGSTRSPLWRTGGVVFGPRAGKRRLDMPRRKARLALSHALSARAADGAIIVVDNLKIEEPKTKAVVSLLKNLGCVGKTLFVLDMPDANLVRASRNLQGVRVLLAGDLNAYTILNCGKVVLTKPAAEKLSARWN